MQVLTYLLKAIFSAYTYGRKKTAENAERKNKMAEVIHYIVVIELSGEYYIILIVSI